MILLHLRFKTDRPCATLGDLDGYQGPHKIDSFNWSQNTGELNVVLYAQGLPSLFRHVVESELGARLTYYRCL